MRGMKGDNTQGEGEKKVYYLHEIFIKLYKLTWSLFMQWDTTTTLNVVEVSFDKNLVARILF